MLTQLYAIKASQLYNDIFSTDQVVPDHYMHESSIKIFKSCHYSISVYGDKMISRNEAKNDFSGIILDMKIHLLEGKGH